PTQAGKRVRPEEDTDGNGRIDTVTDYDGDTILRRRADTDGNGSYDTESSYERGVERKQVRDADQDGRPDAIITFSASGDRELEQYDTKGSGRCEGARRVWQGRE